MSGIITSDAGFAFGTYTEPLNTTEMSNTQVTVCEFILSKGNKFKRSQHKGHW